MTSVSWFLEGLRQDLQLQVEVERDEPQSLSQANESAEKGERVVRFSSLARLFLGKNEDWFMPWAVTPKGRHKIHRLTKRPHFCNSWSSNKDEYLSF